MTGAELLDVIASAVEAAPVESVTGRDVLRRMDVASGDVPLDERMFAVIPQTLPERSEIGCLRRVELSIAIAYTWTASAAARVLDDGILVVDALEGIPGLANDVARVEVTGTQIDQVDATIVSSVLVAVDYTAD